MDYQQDKSKQRSQVSANSTASISLEDLSKVVSKPSGKSAGAGEGGIVLQIIDALDEYSSNKKTLDKMPEIKAPGEKNFLSRFFYKIFTSKSKKAADQEKYEKELQEQEEQRAELNSAMSDSLTKYNSLMGKATPNDLKKIIETKGLVNRIMSELPSANVKSSMDLLYKHVDDKNKDLLMDIIEARYGVPVLDGTDKRLSKVSDRIRNWYLVTKVIKVYPDGHEQTVEKRPTSWTLEALKRVYEIYALLPSRHLDLVECLVHYEDDNYGGAAWGTEGVYYVNYNKDDIDKVENYKKEWETKGYGTMGHNDRASDLRNGLKYVNMTIAHELGHVVDGKHNNYGYSNSDSFRKWSEWVEVKYSDPKAVVKFMKESMKDKPFGDKLTSHEKDLVDDIAQTIVTEEPVSWTHTENLIKTKLKADSKLNDTSRESLQDILSDQTISSNLLYRLYVGLGNNMACYEHETAMTGMKRPFWQGYSQDSWFSFNNARWSNKISCYQYRCPKEEFAETYASYHVAPTATNSKGKAYKKGERTPEGLRTWFEKEGLHLMDPDNVSGTSEMSGKEKKAS